MPEINAMSHDQISKLATIAFGNTITLLAQQMKSKLEQTVTVKTGLKGKIANPADQIGEMPFHEQKQRFEDTPIDEIERQKRWYAFKTHKAGIGIDNEDEIKTTYNPQDGLVTAGMAAIGRNIDKEIMSGFEGPNKVGIYGESEIKTLPKDRIIPYSHGGGDILKKLNAAEKLLKKSEVDTETEEIYAVAVADVAEELAESGIYINSLHMTDRVLARKTLIPYRIFNFVEYQRIKPVPSIADGSKMVYRVPIYCKSGMGLGKWGTSGDVFVRISELQAKSYAWHLFMRHNCGASRLEEAKCAAVEVAVRN